ncbi:hypothetical protein K469DRAFT_707368, partial [Zopfia rhizophila CBS 207.26]
MHLLRLVLRDGNAKFEGHGQEENTVDWKKWRVQRRKSRSHDILHHVRVSI